MTPKLQMVCGGDLQPGDVLFEHATKPSWMASTFSEVGDHPRTLGTVRSISPVDALTNRYVWIDQKPRTVQYGLPHSCPVYRPDSPRDRLAAFLRLLADGVDSGLIDQTSMRQALFASDTYKVGSLISELRNEAAGDPTVDRLWSLMAVAPQE